MSRLLRALATGLMLISLAGCTSAFANALARGDQFAASGMWDEAADAYQVAAQLEPESAEAAIKLQQARRAQANLRLQRAWQLEQRGDLPGALALVRQAIAFDPNNMDANTAFNRIVDSLLELAAQHLAADRPRRTLELTEVVLNATPRHPRALELDNQARTVLAERALANARAYRQQNLLGNALVELAIGASYQPDFEGLDTTFAEVRRALEAELNFQVVFDYLTAAGDAEKVATAVTSARLASSLNNAGALITVIRQQPAEPAAGAVLSGRFTDYGYTHKKRTENRSCEYVCGTETVANPRRATLENDLARYEEQLSDKEDDVADAQQEVTRYEIEIDRINSDVQRRQNEVDRAQQALDRCKQNAKPKDHGACRSKRSTLNSARSRLQSERRRLASPQDNLSRARRDLASAQQKRDEARRQRDQTRQELYATPRMITVNRYCTFSYPVQIHDVDVHVSMWLGLRRLSEQLPAQDKGPYRFTATKQDESFPPHPNRCREIAVGDPLQLPTEEQLRAAMVDQVLRELRAEVLNTYGGYRKEFLLSGRRLIAARQPERAAEELVRYGLLGPIDRQTRAELIRFFDDYKQLRRLDLLFRSP